MALEPVTLQTEAMMTLRIVQRVSGGALSNELLDAIDAELAELPAPEGDE